MGMRASASVVYGVDLGDGEYGELYVQVPDEHLEDGLYEALDTLVDEFIGWTEEQPPYVIEGEGYQRWADWLDRRREYVKAHHTPVGHDSYGYEYSGTVITSASAGSAEYDASPVNLTETNEEELEKFLQFLESKGWVFNPEKRKPQWLVTASYG